MANLPVGNFRVPRTNNLPSYVHDASFADRNAETRYDWRIADAPDEHATTHMPDEVTRDFAKRMHYAAFRWHRVAHNPKQAALWEQRYYRLRDRVVLGNRKLVYRAVRRRMALSNRHDDLIGDCHIVLIQAVAVFNPWLGIRFSTYAYTCLVRALSRLSQRMASDWLSRTLPLEALADGEPGNTCDDHFTGFPRLEEYLREDHPLLSDREKTIIARRFFLTETVGTQTLEKVGRELGLSKERVRQVQASALGKLRKALSEEVKVC